MEKQVYSADLKSAAFKRHPGSTPGTRTIFLAFVQWIGQDSSKVLIGVRFPYAGPIKL